MYTLYNRAGKSFECLNLRSFAAHLKLNSPFKASLQFVKAVLMAASVSFFSSSKLNSSRNSDRRDTSTC